MANARVARGRKSQGIAAEYLRANGFPMAMPVWGSMPGRDIHGTPGLAFEVKARRDLDLTGDLRQSARNAKDDVPVLLIRPDGYGEARIAEWILALSFADAVKLFRAAGYGVPLPHDEL
jgi:hypothetical protein